MSRAQRYCARARRGQRGGGRWRSASARPGDGKNHSSRGENGGPAVAAGQLRHQRASNSTPWHGWGIPRKVGGAAATPSRCSGGRSGESVGSPRRWGRKEAQGSTGLSRPALLGDGRRFTRLPPRVSVGPGGSLASGWSRGRQGASGVPLRGGPQPAGAGPVRAPGSSGPLAEAVRRERQAGSRPRPLPLAWGLRRAGSAAPLPLGCFRHGCKRGRWRANGENKIKKKKKILGRLLSVIRKTPS